jgi:hypothetical protein
MHVPPQAQTCRAPLYVTTPDYADVFGQTYLEIQTAPA